MKEFVLSADLGGTNLRMASVSGDGDILHRVKNPVPVSKSKEEIVKSIAQSVGRCLEELDGEAHALALAVPGIVDAEAGLIFRAPNLPDLNRFRIADAVRDECGVGVIVENDANCAAIGESWLGNSRGSDCSLMVTLGTGVGGGIIIDGKVLRGIDGTAGEIGHINVEPEGHPCGCGSRGCLEQYSSASAVARLAAEAISPAEMNGDGPLTSKRVFQLASEGEKWALDVFEKQGYYLGIALAGLVNCFNPEVIVLGGGGAGGAEFFMPSLKREMKSRTYEEPFRRVKILRSLLEDDAGILGAAKLAFDHAADGVAV